MFIYTQLLDLFICRWAFELFSYLGYCTKHGTEHRYAHILSYVVLCCTYVQIKVFFCLEVTCHKVVLLLHMGVLVQFFSIQISFHKGWTRRHSHQKGSFSSQPKTLIASRLLGKCYNHYQEITLQCCFNLLFPISSEWEKGLLLAPSMLLLIILAHLLSVFWWVFFSKFLL